MTMTGLFVPLITPFAEDGTVALDALAGLARHLLDGGATGLVALGTTAEPGALSPAERRAVLDTVARACRERSAPLLVGAHTAEELTALAGRPEVSAALTLVPPFVRPGERGVLAHLAHLAALSPVPLVAYHVPYRTGQSLSVEALRELAAIPGVVGVKHAVGALDPTTVRLLADPPPGFAVLGGDDELLSPVLALGAHGGIAASAHLATGDFTALVAAWRVGDVARARPLGHRLAALAAALFAEPNPTVVKAVLHAEGRIPTPAVRLPLLPASASSATAALRRLAALADPPADAGTPAAGAAREPAAVPPETADWTFVIARGCRECGFTPQPAEATAARLRASVPLWRARLARPDARDRPAPTVWSPVEYACHVRDTCRIFRQRLALMLREDDPTFANWDQDATALAEDYFHRNPAEVAEQLAVEAEATAAAFDAVRDDQWERPGRRDNGSLFTVRSFAVYFLHDVLHHEHDVTR
ncbi:4-hydroxy-tetrahydrodipicolinate synthase [Micromonospora mirobrigensis]|uniref:4-hydroxy-tetrahydrodipicolinate synthase n=1 Tax=Micromonospora mirobrigensis TaxID=262898 RepID=A0A1C4YNG2_9ACTN|nr:4-hydroxy-tetrahydrodipicolinate synthase [Micromonospora mirobrigensis]